MADTPDTCDTRETPGVRFARHVVAQPERFGLPAIRDAVALYRATQAVIEAAHDRGMALSQEAAREIATAAVDAYLESRR